MKALLSAIVAFIQEDANGMKPFIGSYISGNSEQYGPFMGRAPMSQGRGPSLPFMVYDMLPNASDQGFLQPLQIVEKPIVRFHLYDDDPDRLADNVDAFTNKFDTLTSLNLGGGEQCRSIVRYDSPVYMPEPTGKDGSQTYHAMIVYEFRNARNRGG